MGEHPDIEPISTVIDLVNEDEGWQKRTIQALIYWLSLGQNDNNDIQFLGNFKNALDNLYNNDPSNNLSDSVAEFGEKCRTWEGKYTGFPVFSIEEQKGEPIVDALEQYLKKVMAFLKRQPLSFDSKKVLFNDDDALAYLQVCGFGNNVTVSRTGDMPRISTISARWGVLDGNALQKAFPELGRVTGDIHTVNLDTDGRVESVLGKDLSFSKDFGNLDLSQIEGGIEGVSWYTYEGEKRITSIILSQGASGVDKIGLEKLFPALKRKDGELKDVLDLDGVGSIVITYSLTQDQKLLINYYEGKDSLKINYPQEQSV